jgi:hypothetical protein
MDEEEIGYAEGQWDTIKEIFSQLDSFIEPMKIYDEDGTVIDMPTLNLIKYLEYQKQLKKRFKVD